MWSPCWGKIKKEMLTVEPSVSPTNQMLKDSFFQKLKNKNNKKIKLKINFKIKKINIQ